MEKQSHAPTERDRNRADLRRMADSYHFGATRVGAPGCEARRSAAEAEALLRWAIGESEAADLIAEEREAWKARAKSLQAALELIAHGDVPPDQHGHYLAHRQAVHLARRALQKARLQGERGLQGPASAHGQFREAK
jgi:hypothetical protein